MISFVVTHFNPKNTAQLHQNRRLRHFNLNTNPSEKEREERVGDKRKKKGQKHTDRPTDANTHGAGALKKANETQSWRKYQMF